MQTILYVKDRDGAFLACAEVDARGAILRPSAYWNLPNPTDQHAIISWAYDDQRSIALSGLHFLLIDSSAWVLDGIDANDGTLKVYVSPVDGYADPFAEKGGEKGAEKGALYPFIAKGADVHHGMQLVATATSNNFARRIAEALTLYRGKLSYDRRDQRRRAAKGGN